MMKVYIFSIVLQCVTILKGLLRDGRLTLKQLVDMGQDKGMCFYF